MTGDYRTTVLLGRASATLHADGQTAPVIQKCFKQVIGQTADFEMQLDSVPDLSAFIEQIIDDGYAKHSTHVYIDAATLVSPKGETAMLVGASQRGKTTTSLALCLQRAAKFVCEDISIVDFSAGQILNLVAPLSIREKTIKLYADLGIAPLQLIADRWYACRELFEDKHASIENGVNYVFVFMTPGSEDKPLKTGPLSASEALRAMLPISNLLVHPSGCESMLEVLQRSNIFAIYDGTLEQRLTFLRACLEGKNGV